MAAVQLPCCSRLKITRHSPTPKQALGSWLLLLKVAVATEVVAAEATEVVAAKAPATAVGAHSVATEMTAGTADVSVAAAANATATDAVEAAAESPFCNFGACSADARYADLRTCSACDAHFHHFCAITAGCEADANAKCACCLNAPVYAP